MKIEDVKKVVIAGAGTMGQQIGVQCALHGFEVVIYDIREDILENAFQRIKRLLKYLVKAGRAKQEEADRAVERITGTTDMREAAENADIVSEAVPEDPDLKEEVLSRFNGLCPEHTIFTTNTSTLLPSILAEGTGRPDRFMALHFHDVRVTDMVDVMAHPGTSEETLDLVTEFAVRIGQVPIVLKKENQGYIFNFMLTALFQAAQTLAANEVASIQEIDRDWMGIVHMPIGPFGLMDSIGIDTVWKVTDYWANESKDEQELKNAGFLKKYVDKGHLGQKSGRGFYSSPGPAYAEPGFLRRDHSDQQ